MRKTAAQCPVEALIPLLLEAWDAMNGAEYRKLNSSNAYDQQLYDDLFDFKEHLTDRATFEMASSLVGAALQVGIARSELSCLMGCFSEEAQNNAEVYRKKIDRLLASASVALRDLAKGDPVAERTISIYVGTDDYALRWQEEMPALAKEGREATG